MPNLTAASQNLYELVKGRNFILYPDSDIRLAMQRSVAIETSRGWRIAKEKQAHKIDVVVALGMAAFGAVKSQRFQQYTGFCGPIVFGEHGRITPLYDYEKPAEKPIKFVRPGSGNQ